MHKIHTFILRMFIDYQEVGVLKGSLQPVPEGEAQTFADKEGFLVTLQRLIGGAADAGKQESAKKPPLCEAEEWLEKDDESSEFDKGAEK